MSATAVDEAAVPAAYRHHRRMVTHGPSFRLGRADVKWYEIRRTEAPMPEGLAAETQAFLRSEVAAQRLEIDGQPGFVMLHLADSAAGPNSVALLLVSSWRFANELWESLYWKPVAGGEYRRVEKGPHAATYCVWELAAVWHERNAWDRYLDSARDDAARAAYLADRFSGVV